MLPLLTPPCPTRRSSDLFNVGEDPADKVRQVRKGMTVSEMCSWYLEEARAGNILGRKNVPIKTSSLDLDESRIRTHIGPLIGNRIVKHLTIAIVEQMQTDRKSTRLNSSH